MKEKILKLYFPGLTPRYLHAAKWRCLKGYGAADIMPNCGAIKVVRCVFKAQNSAAAGKRILFFSDLHYTPREEALAQELCDLISKLRVDLLLCGGDICSDAVHINALPPLLDRLSETAPVCAAVHGNWERGKDWLPDEFWQQLFQKHNWHFLCNNALDVADWGWVYGCDEISRGYPALLDKTSEPREKIFLVHRPDTVITVDRETPLDDFTLSLCGHTHGGQIRLPLIGALAVPSYYGRQLACGLYGKENCTNRMIVSTGINHASFPWRFNCRREVLLIEFE